jgi:hypothetical protein
MIVEVFFAELQGPAPAGQGRLGGRQPRAPGRGLGHEDVQSDLSE